jgi:hypothetical protein
MGDDRVVTGVDGSAVGVAVDRRTASPTVSVWIVSPAHPILGANLSAEAARELADRLTRAVGEAASL